MENAIIKPKLSFSDKARDRVVFSICLICIFLFLYTAFSKILAHARFLQGLSRAEFIGKFAEYLAWLVPASEILTAILLIVPKTCQWGLRAFIILMISFTIYILGMLFWATTLPCHCGGAIEKLNWTQHVWFNLAFIVLATFAVRLAKTRN